MRRESDGELMDNLSFESSEPDGAIMHVCWRYPGCTTRRSHATQPTTDPTISHHCQLAMDACYGWDLPLLAVQSLRSVQCVVLPIQRTPVRGAHPVGSGSNHHHYGIAQCHKHRSRYVKRDISMGPTCNKSLPGTRWGRKRILALSTQGSSPKLGLVPITAPPNVSLSEHPLPFGPEVGSLMIA